MAYTGASPVGGGAEREIWWKPKAHKGEVPREWRQTLAHGSLFVMPPGFQREYLHRVPKCDHAVGVRVSLTFRRYRDTAPETECDCPCHHHPAMMHFDACCQGQCAACGRWYEVGLAAHRARCAAPALLRSDPHGD